MVSWLFGGVNVAHISGLWLRFSFLYFFCLSPVFCVLYVAIFLECPSFDYSFRFSPTFIPKDVNVRVLVAVITNIID